jgi:hypothetical protein
MDAAPGQNSLSRQQASAFSLALGEEMTARAEFIDALLGAFAAPREVAATPLC